MDGELLDNTRSPSVWVRLNEEWSADDELVGFVPVARSSSSPQPSLRPILLSSDDVLNLAELRYAGSNALGGGQEKRVIDLEVEFSQQAPALASDGTPQAELGPDTSDLEDDLPPPKDLGASTMSQPSREEIDAKFQAVEARMDARVSEVTSRMDSLLARLDAREAIQETQFAHINEKLDSLSGLRTVVITTVLGTGISIVGLVYAMMTGMSSSYDSGRDTAQLTASAQVAADKAQAAAEKSANATEAALRAINFAISEAENKRQSSPAVSSEPNAGRSEKPDSKRP